VAVAEFYKSDFKKYDQLRKSISQITGLVNNFDSVEIKDADNCVAYFNQAVILYHLQKPHSALKIMKAVMKWMDALDENLLQRAGVLTIHLLLDTNQYKSANLLLEDLQKRWGIPMDPEDEEFISVREAVW
jgi:CCR4-NOT transcription complex subunit 10